MDLNDRYNLSYNASLASHRSKLDRG